MSEFLVKPSVTSAIARLRTYLNIVLDKSGSMLKVRQATIDAYNAFLDSQRTDRVDDLFVTLTQFSDRERIEVSYRVTPITDVRSLRLETYIPEGLTALYDGVAQTLAAMEREVGPQARVLTVVLTDGGDNASREVEGAESLAAIIREYERRGNWTFVLLAADLNAYKAGATMGFAPGNVQSYAAAHVTEALATVARGVTAYRHGDQLQTGEFFTARKFRRTQWVQDVEDAGVGEAP
jgi:hypothetical protein